MTDKPADLASDLSPQELPLPKDGSLGLRVDSAAPADENAGPETKDMKAVEAHEKAAEDQRLEQGLENTFPASDPVAAKHIT